MSRNEIFEKYYAEQNDLPVESMQQHRWWNQDGYRDPKIAAAYRNFCAGWDALDAQNQRSKKNSLTTFWISNKRTLSMVDCTELKRLAEASTSGEWYANGDLRYEDRRSGDTHGLHHDDESFIAVASPAAVLELIAEYERLFESDQEAIKLCDTLSLLLGEIAVAVRGPEEPKSRHGFADLPSRVKKVVSERDQLKAENEALRKDAECVDDLSALVRQLVHRLRKASPDNELPEKALDYLKRKGLQGSPLRSERDDAAELEAQKIYDSWAGHEGFVPWVKGGNSLKQDEARRLARAAMGKGERPWA